MNRKIMNVDVAEDQVELMMSRIMRSRRKVMLRYVEDDVEDDVERSDPTGTHTLCLRLVEMHLDDISQAPAIVTGTLEPG